MSGIKKKTIRKTHIHKPQYFDNENTGRYLELTGEIRIDSQCDIHIGDEFLYKILEARLLNGEKKKVRILIMEIE